MVVFKSLHFQQQEMRFVLLHVIQQKENRSFSTKGNRIVSCFDPSDPYEYDLTFKLPHSQLLWNRPVKVAM